MNGRWASSKQFRANRVGVDASNMNGLVGSRPPSEDLDSSDRDAQSIRDHASNGLIGSATLRRVCDAKLQSLPEHARNRVPTCPGNDLQIDLDTFWSLTDSRIETHAGWGMMPPRSSSGRSSERGCSGGGVLSDFLASSFRRSATVAFSSASPRMIRSMSSF